MLVYINYKFSFCKQIYHINPTSNSYSFSLQDSKPTKYGQMEIYSTFSTLSYDYQFDIWNLGVRTRDGKTRTTAKWIKVVGLCSLLFNRPWRWIYYRSSKYWTFVKKRRRYVQKQCSVKLKITFVEFNSESLWIWYI